MRDSLLAIFFAVKNHFIWTADEEHELNWNGKIVKMKEHWDLMVPDANGTLRGDCEDFALYCSRMVKKILEIPKEYRRLTYCQTETGEGHMVLTVYVGDANYVFDNRQRTLTTLNKLKAAGYKNFAQPDTVITGNWSKV